ncbi:hypothetical protein B0H67DRAFT_181879 [Lasiosphaeris hirsuta]|uniref:Uncharacterized protein n=1 Tax=Lasiosphaeris hirsuta TaxID=260670 RepID=A0AA40AQT0_9PEZI|nr:hypothetical protein B0H67DRAFT_181879 [Lasiosphaeris hirsuta]
MNAHLLLLPRWLKIPPSLGEPGPCTRFPPRGLESAGRECVQGLFYLFAAHCHADSRHAPIPNILTTQCFQMLSKT